MILITLITISYLWWRSQMPNTFVFWPTPLTLKHIREGRNIREAQLLPSLQSDFNVSLKFSYKTFKYHKF